MLGQLCLVLLLEHGLHVRLLGLQLLDGRPEALEEGDLLLEVAHALLLLLLRPSLQLARCGPCGVATQSARRSPLDGLVRDDVAPGTMSLELPSVQVLQKKRPCVGFGVIRGAVSCCCAPLARLLAADGMRVRDPHKVAMRCAARTRPSCDPHCAVATREPSR